MSRGRPIARLGGAAPTPSWRGPGEAGSAGPSCGPRGRGSAEPPELGRAGSLSRSGGRCPDAGLGPRCGRQCGGVRPPLQRDVTVPESQPPSAALAPLAPPQPDPDARARPAPPGFWPPSFPSSPPPPSCRGSSHDPPNGASRAPIPYPFSLPAQAEEPAGASGEAPVRGSPAPGRAPSSPRGRAKLGGGIPPPVPEGLGGERTE